MIGYGTGGCGTGGCGMMPGFPVLYKKEALIEAILLKLVEAKPGLVEENIQTAIAYADRLGEVMAERERVKNLRGECFRAKSGLDQARKELEIMKGCYNSCNAEYKRQLRGGKDTSKQQRDNAEISMNNHAAMIERNKEDIVKAEKRLADCMAEAKQAGIKVSFKEKGNEKD